MTYKHTVEINEYKGWLIITILNNGPKIRLVGNGILFSSFNKNDLYISPEALNVLTTHINKVNNDPSKKDPVLEIIAPDRIWWASLQSIIIPPDEHYNIYTLPYHTSCINNVDPKVIETINKTHI